MLAINTFRFVLRYPPFDSRTYCNVFFFFPFYPSFFTLTIFRFANTCDRNNIRFFSLSLFLRTLAHIHAHTTRTHTLSLFFSHLFPPPPPPSTLSFTCSHSQHPTFPLFDMKLRGYAKIDARNKMIANDYSPPLSSHPLPALTSRFHRFSLFVPYRSHFI